MSSTVPDYSIDAGQQLTEEFAMDFDYSSLQG